MTKGKSRAPEKLSLVKESLNKSIGWGFELVGMLCFYPSSIWTQARDKSRASLMYTTLMHVIAILLIDDLDVVDQPVFQVTGGILQRLLTT